MSTLFFVLPGPRERRSGGTLYDLRLARELASAGLSVRLLWLGDSFPLPQPADREAALRLFAELPAGARVLVDGLVLGALPEIAAWHGRRLALFALVHHPLAFETGLPPETARRLMVSERAALAGARQVIVTSRTVRDLLVREFGVPFARIAVAPPGTDPAAAASGTTAGPLQLLTVGALIPRKDHLGLIHALAQLADRPWRLDIVGSTTADPVASARVRAAIAAFGFTERVWLAGELAGEALEAAYARADLFVSASRFEGYGMAIAEALARGIPVVAVRAGAVAELLPESAGFLVEPGQPAALAAAIRRLLEDPALRAAMRAGARAAGAQLPKWQESVRTLLRLFATPSLA